MQSLGYRTTMHLYAAFVISGAIASLAACSTSTTTASSARSQPRSRFRSKSRLWHCRWLGHNYRPFIGAGIFLGLRNWVSSFFEMHTAVMGVVFRGDRALGAQRHRGSHVAMVRRRAKTKGEP